MAEAYIVEAVRTAGGRRGGKLAGVHPVDLAAQVLDAVIERSGIPGDAVEDVIMGCVSQGGEQAGQVGRNAVLASKKLAQSTPAVTIDRQCGSSQQSIQFAAQAVMSGTQDVVIAAGIESMSRVPMGSTYKLFYDAGLGKNKSPGLEEKFPGINFNQFAGAEMIAKKYGYTREQLDEYSLNSHRKAVAATQGGKFKDEIVPIEIETPEGKEVHTSDEGIRYDASAEGMAGVKKLSEEGVLTAASSSQICDGASAVLIVSEEALKKYNLKPLAKIVNLTVTAGDPVIMLEEPLFATDKALKKAGLSIDDIDLYEVNEAFASVPVAWLEHTKADPNKLNVNGGAIALGHPLGASGTKLMATLVHELRRRGGRYGLQTMCEGGGVANVTIIENCDWQGEAKAAA
ncbi:acetyl-CoA C-acyltransferase [Sphingomonas sp. ABOLG]|jgi:acetyl-CoA C-acetyltransferase|uniref:acetyl-CoA C-acetyltransferase n=1 Tax=unclassified Sphingomonas TaxID=196159 RepID=UPI0006228A9F|nr:MULTISPECIES: acetyl-CoA C-acetyltransferase [unclassified Sphingomonas]KKI21254.1 acetyl-CoA acetyltransferase [Sphingomonas sp. Ag1]MDF2604810.1 acetyl-CoA C-acyltransferase [Sphingomonas sp.]RSV16470.1 acetyl-CoA C-acyltransferase [Sphingomonas sp. ABOLG]